jgi:hypothetical protein
VAFEIKAGMNIANSVVSFVIRTHLRLSIRNTLACRLQNGSPSDSSGIGLLFNSAKNFWVQRIIISTFFHFVCDLVKTPFSRTGNRTGNDFVSRVNNLLIYNE